MASIATLTRLLASTRPNLVFNGACPAREDPRQRPPRQADFGVGDIYMRVVKTTLTSLESIVGGLQAKIDNFVDFLTSIWRWKPTPFFLSCSA